MDASSGLFGGLVVASAIVMLVVLGATVAAQQGVISKFVAAARENLGALVGGLAVVAIVAAIVGYMLGKGMSQKQAVRARAR
jgi:TRAP-type C4-dicarboxylate transport system permease large subunit